MTQPDTTALQKRLRLAHQARRAKERQLDDILHALMDVGVIEEGDPYSHADLADVIRQLDAELNPEPTTEQGDPDLKTQLAEAEALAGRWEEKYFEMADKRMEALARPKANLDRHKQNLLQALGVDRTRDWDDMCNAARGMLKQLAELKEQRDQQVQARSEALAAIDRVQKAPTAPTGAVPGDLADWDSFLRGYELGVCAAKSALRSPSERHKPTSVPPPEEQP